MKRAILYAGLVCGALDGLSAIGLTLALGGKIERMFQGIAAGVVGAQAASRGGASAALLGLALHFVIAFGAAAVYYAASRIWPLLIRRALACGVLFGVLVHLFMSYVVIPLSAIGPRPFNARTFYPILAIHMIVVGPSISLTIRKFKD